MEFGSLYRLDISQRNTTPTKLLSDSVNALARSPSGAVWAASGLAHMGGERGALYRVDGQKPDVVAAVSGADARVLEKSGVEFPGLTSVAGLAFADSDRPIVVFPVLGVFELTDERFHARYSGPLAFTYLDSDRRSQFLVNSAPVGLVTSTSGDIYVANRSLGVLLIRRSGDGSPIKQLTFAQTAQPQ